MTPLLKPALGLDGLALASPEPAVGGSGPNPNLLLWSEAINNAVWTKTSCVVLADQNGTFDEVVSSSSASAVRQVTSTAAATGAAVTTTVPLSILGAARGSVTGTFDGLSYTFSAKLRDTGNAAIPAVTLRLDRSGGFLRCSAEDPAGDGDYEIGEVQLEQAAAFTAYHRRDGV